MHILIVGKAFSGIKSYLEQHGHSYTVLQDKLATRFPDRKFKNRRVASFNDMNDVITTAEKIHSLHPVEGVLTTYEHYIMFATHIAHHLSLPGLSLEAARACTDKELMRQCFATATEKISPAFKAITSEEELIEFARKHDLPLILKPANLSKSLLVTKSLSLTELKGNYRKSLSIIDKTYAKYAPGRNPKLIVEEFLEGPIFSVDAFVDISGEPYVLENVVDYQTGYDIGFDDNFHYSRILPSKLSQEDIDSIRHTAVVGCRALKMTSSPAHVEIILTKNGPRIVEIGARNGGYRERMHALANDIDITGNAIALSLNKPLDLKPKKNDAVGVFELFPQTPGIFDQISHLKELRQLSSFRYISIKAKPGQFVGKAGDGYKMCAVIILANHDHALFEKDRQFVQDYCTVTTAPAGQRKPE